MFFKPKMSKIFVVKIPKIFDIFIFHSREKIGVWKQEKWCWNAKNTTLFFKNIGFELRFLWFCVAKPIILKSKTYAFGLQNDRFWKTKRRFYLAYLRVHGLKTLNLKVLWIYAFFSVFSDKIFFCSEFSSFEGVNWGFLEIKCQKFSEIKASP